MLNIVAVNDDFVVGNLCVKCLDNFKGYDKIHEYEVTSPKEFVGLRILHTYSDGWLILVATIVRRAKEEKMSFPKTLLR